MPAGGGEPAQHGAARGFLVEMHRLRVEFRRESHDLLVGDEARSVFGNGAWREIFPIKCRHAVSLGLKCDEFVP